MKLPYVKLFKTVLTCELFSSISFTPCVDSGDFQRDTAIK